MSRAPRLADARARAPPRSSAAPRCVVELCVNRRRRRRLGARLAASCDVGDDRARGGRRLRATARRTRRRAHRASVPPAVAACCATRAAGRGSIGWEILGVDPHAEQRRAHLRSAVDDARARRPAPRAVPLERRAECAGPRCAARVIALRVSLAARAGGAGLCRELRGAPPRAAVGSAHVPLATRHRARARAHRPGAAATCPSRSSLWGVASARAPPERRQRPRGAAGAPAAKMGQRAVHVDHRRPLPRTRCVTPRRIRRSL